MTTQKIATRASFGKALAALGEKYPNVVCLDADLSKSTMSHTFAQKFPTRFFEMGIQEANMISAAAGMSFSGKIPFICSFAAFLTGRYDQIRMSIGYSKANVKLIGTHAGVAIGEDGHSQMGLEDIALMRAIPGMTILQPATDQETFEMMEWAINYQGPVYFRLTRQALEQLQTAPFHLGVYPELKSGEKIAFLGTAGLLAEALASANELAKSGRMNPAVYNAHTAKPLNSNFLRRLAENFQVIVVFEDHSTIGGVGSAIAEWMSEYSDSPRRVIRYGVKDVFGESGTPEAILAKHGLLREQITQYFLGK